MDSFDAISALNLEIPGIVDQVSSANPGSLDFFAGLQNIVDNILLTQQQRRELEAFLATQQNEISIATVNARLAESKQKTLLTYLSVAGFAFTIFTYLKKR
jgi:hypothetical protein